MDVLLTIGEFSKMTHLSVKALRHYHDLGLLEPTDVDRTTGYRLYTTTQVPTAQVIRRFRDLEMPLDEVRAVLQAPDEASRNRAILVHLDRMEARLQQTQVAVASLRALLLDGAGPPVSVEYRSIGRTRSFGIREMVSVAEIGQWCAEVYPLLHAVLAGGGVPQTGVDAALYSEAFFESEIGEVVAFIPVVDGSEAPASTPRVQLIELPAIEYAVLVHQGPFSELDRTYGALGSHVAELGIGAGGPVREQYLVTPDDTPDEARHVTEVCWPITHNPNQPTTGTKGSNP